ncbi:MAG: ubiquinone/menaquinone biosynthesis methyltransferase [Bacteroidota bacterium]|nr:ubiquinone/menaquinone biosynthesis methyltransferase [Chlorobiota bacterium]MDW8271733.1 ubiquinone/menaquinone biosynthesis methyltransferase [Bacteroidota bacterium]
MSQAVEQMFARIAGQYDLANTLITAGLHHRWRRKAVQLSNARPAMHVLDCATGTGDFALAFAHVVGPTGQVIATDVCMPMLDVFRKKIEGIAAPIRIEYANMEQLPYPDATFDIVSCGYGVRNADNPWRALAEMARVTKPGGRVVILETGVPHHWLLRAFYTVHVKVIVPLIGQLIVGDREAYRYLPRTAARFPYGNAFAERMYQTNAFESVAVYPLLGGASYIYVGTKRS